MKNEKQIINHRGRRGKQMHQGGVSFSKIESYSASSAVKVWHNEE